MISCVGKFLIEDYFDMPLPDTIKDIHSEYGVEMKKIEARELFDRVKQWHTKGLPEGFLKVCAFSAFCIFKLFCIVLETQKWIF